MNADSNPTLPPKLHESERMFHVQKWVNSLTWETESTSYAPSAPDSSATDNSHMVNSGQEHHHNYFFPNNFQHNYQVDNTFNNMTSSRRLFTNEENRLLVKLFRDYFNAKICPNLPEVRARIQNTKIGSDRGPISVRNKFKRLQSDNQWINYI